MSGLFGGGGSNSNSNTSTSTTNTDKRLVVSSGVGVSSDSSTVTVNTLDSGIVTQALQTVAGADANAGQNLNGVLALAGKLFDGGFKALADSQAMTAQAYSNATTDKAGAIDNKTIAIIAVAAAAAWAMAKH